MHMIGISGRCVAEPNAPPAASTLPLRTPAHVEGARPSPSAKRDAKSAEPKILGGSAHYAAGVFNSCLATLRNATRHLDDPCLSSVHEDLRDRLREGHDVLFLQAV